MRTDDEIKEWLAIREREALKDADTAEVTWSYRYFPDPHDVDEDLQEEERVVGRVCCSPSRGILPAHQRHDMLRPCVQRGSLLRRPFVALVDTNNAGPRA